MKQDLTSKQITIVGAGLSGQAAARFLVERGAEVTLSDMRAAAEIPQLDRLSALPIRFDMGGHSLKCFSQADLIVISPGVCLDIEPLNVARAHAVPIIGEIELAACHLDAPILAVTGTNGKSTTVSLLGAALQQCGKEVFVGGNLGTPLIEACAQDELDYLVVELSSFQLETIDRFCPHYALLLNLSADHLDRYPDLDSYYAAKLNLFRNMTTAHTAVLNADDEAVVQLTADLNCRKVYFSAKGSLAEGMGREGEELVWRWQGEEVRFALSKLSLQGAHNVENVMAALIPALIEGCSSEKVWNAVCRFEGLRHRMNLVRELDGVRWYNDSKGTNIGSVQKSLAGFETPVTLIAGGKDKGGDYRLLAEELRRTVTHLILIGEAAERMVHELDGVVPIHRVDSLEQAVSLAQQVTSDGGNVLLSPACSSFDMFENYARRGDIFCELVGALETGGGA